jgi:hypothetical protein
MLPTYVWVILAVALILAAIISISRRTKAAKEKSQENIGRELRLMMLTTRPSKTGEKPTPEFPRIYGVLMDWPIGNQQIATVLSTSQGTASLYTTSTFGIIGGEGHEAVRNAAKEFVRAADRFFDSSTLTTEHPYPASDRVRFSFLTFGGVRVIDTELAAINQRTSQFTELFALGQNVLTQLRLATEERR